MKDPRAFIQSLGDEVITILQSDGVDGPDRERRFQQLFTEAFDTPTIARFVLGRYWRAATPEQRTEYLELFREYVANIYAERFSTYSGETFAVTQQRPLKGGDTLVGTEIRRPDDLPTTVNFRVHAGQEGLKIVDVVVEGVSMIVTKRSEFQSIAAREGVDGLIDRLRRVVERNR